MGLTHSSVGRNAADAGLIIRKQTDGDRVIALAGNPNVGKSTVFNGLTGMNQHTGNWPGKTVTNAQGYCKSGTRGYVFVDLPGTYSLFAHSAEEETARDFLCFGEPDAVAVVCDATCLERNLNLVLQTIECAEHVVVCVNLIDEAKKKGIRVDLSSLERELGVPVVATVARKKKTLGNLLDALEKETEKKAGARHQIPYPEPIENALEPIEAALAGKPLKKLSPRFLALRLLDADPAFLRSIASYLGFDYLADETLALAVQDGRKCLSEAGIGPDEWKDLVVSAIVAEAERVAASSVSAPRGGYGNLDRKLDRIFTGKATGYLVMLLLLLGIFFLTIKVSDILSGWLSDALFSLSDLLTGVLDAVRSPPWLKNLLIDGIYRVLAWVVSVMLPPMAIFFPLFTLLEDSGYLPRIAYNLDRPFRRCNACGKQALTMCMGFGCNAAGVVGCRIIDSPRERLLAILTNSFVPCNGRFPALISLITMFFLASAGGFGASLLSAAFLTLAIISGVGMTFLVTKLLSVTVLRGLPTSFTLELPSFRRPQIGQVIVRSVFDRTLFVLGRAAAVAAPAGLFIWILANVTVGGASLLSHCADFLDPFARLMGMDGIILMAFLLGFPANEIVIPMILMGYLADGKMPDLPPLGEIREILVANGWTPVTALCVLVFFLFHAPCSTTLLTVKKETGSIRWTLLAAALPTLIGILLCMGITLLSKIT